MTLIPHLGLAYPPPQGATRHARHNVDLYLPASKPKGLILFVHGGAWGSSSSLDPSLDLLPSMFPQDFALAIPNYRLSKRDEPPLHHPAHVEDVKAAVRWLIEEKAGGLLDEATTDNVWTMGHSAGAVGGFQLQDLVLEVKRKEKLIKFLFLVP
jgi:acetyl esterase/lipase